MPLSRRLFVAGAVATTMTAKQATADTASKTHVPPTLTPVSIARERIEFADDGVAFESQALKASLDEQRDEILTALRYGAPSLQADDISLDASGRVFVNNEEFRALLLKAEAADSLNNLNIGCINNGC